MKLKSIVRVAVLALPLVLVSCKSHKKAVGNTSMYEQPQTADFVKQVRDNQHVTVNTFPGLVHTARHTMGVGNARSQ